MTGPNANTIAVLRIELEAIEPLIWRRVAVPTLISLEALHTVIQNVMGWLDCHLWQFEVHGRGRLSFGSVRSLAASVLAAKRLSNQASEPSKPITVAICNDRHGTFHNRTQRLLSANNPLSALGGPSELRAVVSVRKPFEGNAMTEAVTLIHHADRCDRLAEACRDAHVAAKLRLLASDYRELATERASTIRLASATIVSLADCSSVDGLSDNAAEDPGA
jgi:hypothetical protein